MDDERDPIEGDEKELTDLDPAELEDDVDLGLGDDEVDGFPLDDLGDEAF